MDITQAFYDSIAAQYDKLFLDWHATTREQSVILDRIFHSHCFDRSAALLDCACNIGTQAIGLAALGYSVTASNISREELAETAKHSAEHNVNTRFEQANFRALVRTFPEKPPYSPPLYPQERKRSAGVLPDLDLGGKSLQADPVHSGRQRDPSRQQIPA